MGRFERKLDLDLITKMANGWKPHKEAKPLKKQKPPRPSNTYRRTRKYEYALRRRAQKEAQRLLLTQLSPEAKAHE